MHFVSIKEFQQLTGMSPQNIHHLISNQKIYTSGEGRGRRIDLDHEKTRIYLRKREFKDSYLDSISPEKQNEERVRPDIDIESIGELADLSLREIVTKHGTVAAFEKLVGTLKKIEDVRGAHLKNSKLEGTLVERELVELIIAEFNNMNKQLLIDIAKTSTKEVIKTIKVDGSVKDCQHIVEKNITRLIKSTKNRIAKLIKNESN